MKFLSHSFTGIKIEFGEATMGLPVVSNITSQPLDLP